MITCGKFAHKPHQLGWKPFVSDGSVTTINPSNIGQVNVLANISPLVSKLVSETWTLEN